MVIEAGVIAGYVIAWAMRKVRRAADPLDAEVDAAIDAGLEKLHGKVAAKLAAHPALEDLAEEAAADGQISELTRQQVELALIAAARKDEGFGHVVTELVAEVRAAERASGISAVPQSGGRVFGDGHARASEQGMAFGNVGGDVNVVRGGSGGQAPDPSKPGRPGH